MALQPCTFDSGYVVTRTLIGRVPKFWLIIHSGSSRAWQHCELGAKRAREAANRLLSLGAGACRFHYVNAR